MLIHYTVPTAAVYSTWKTLPWSSAVRRRKRKKKRDNHVLFSVHIQSSSHTRYRRISAPLWARFVFTELHRPISGLWSGGRSRGSRARWPSSSSRPWSRSAGRGRWWSSATTSTWTSRRWVLAGARVPLCVLRFFKNKPCGGATSAHTHTHTHTQCRRDGAVLTNQFPSPPTKHTESHDHTTNTFLRSEREVQAANYWRNVKTRHVSGVIRSCDDS